MENPDSLTKFPSCKEERGVKYVFGIKSQSLTSELHTKCISGTYNEVPV